MLSTAVPETDGHKVMWPAFAAMIGVDPDSVEFINIESTAKVSALASHNADVVFELLTGYPNFASAIPDGGFSYFLWADYGFNCFGVEAEALVRYEWDREWADQLSKALYP